MTMIDPATAIGTILKAALSLDGGHIIFGYENWSVPQDQGLYVVITDMGPRPVAVMSDMNGAGDGTMVETQSATMLHMIQIDMMSFNDDARSRAWEVLSAFGVTAAQRVMEDNNLQISRHPAPFLNTSALEETANLKRYTTTVLVTALQSKTQNVDFFDTFEIKEVVTNE